MEELKNTLVSYYLSLGTQFAEAMDMDLKEEIAFRKHVLAAVEVAIKKLIVNNPTPRAVGEYVEYVKAYSPGEGVDIGSLSVEAVGIGFIVAQAMVGALGDKL